MKAQQRLLCAVVTAAMTMAMPLPGVLGQALEFPGGSAHVVVGTRSTFSWLHGRYNPDDLAWSVSCWYRDLETSDVFRVIWGTREGTSSEVGAGLFRLADGHLAPSIGNGRDREYVIQWPSGRTIRDQNWHHVVVTIDFASSSLHGKLYLDGAFDSGAYRTEMKPSMADAQDPLIFAHDHTGAYPRQALADIRLYKRALTDKEVRAIYDAAPSGSDSVARDALVAAWAGDPAKVVDGRLQEGADVADVVSGKYVGIAVGGVRVVPWPASSTETETVVPQSPSPEPAPTAPSPAADAAAPAVVEPAAPAPPAATPHPSGATAMERMAQLKQLKEAGLISDDEYEQKRKSILNDL